MKKSTLFNHEPRWRENRIGTRHQLSEAMQSWIYEPGSLTQRLRGEFGNQVAVNVLAQRWQMPFLSERLILAQPAQRYCLVREVLLHCQGLPLILARTVIPASTIKLAHGNLARLGTRPLGEVIFACPELTRVAMDVTLVKPGQWAAQALTMGGGMPVWGRRTLYAVRNQEMLVSEFFLSKLG